MKKIILFVYIFASVSVSAQTQGIKQQAISFMDKGLYGEAIELLNRYVTQNPREAEGYHLRGQCHEIREDYQHAVLDYRRATRLDPSDEQIKADLNRARAVWDQILYKRIDGLKRELAKDPSNPVPYLEIGKSYRWLEMWYEAEMWYDRHLAMVDKVSADEMIRYTEILSHTRNIAKGERAMIPYLDYYPDDWRIMSRYAYFAMWIGKNDAAIREFRSALEIKPFFKEAQDGLDQALKEGYMQRSNPRSFEREYPIDRFYRILKRDPNNDEVRFSIIEELVAEERFEEAMTQLQYLEPNYAGTDRFERLKEIVTQTREETYKSKIQQLQDAVVQNPADGQAVQELALYYSNLNEYDTAKTILSNYLEIIPEDYDARYLYSKILSYNREFDKALTEVLKSVEGDPTNNDYLLFAGQLGVWLDINMEKSEEYLNSVVNDEPDNVNALIALGTLNFQKENQDLERASELADRAEQVEPGNPDVIQLKSMIEMQRIRNEEMEIVMLLENARIETNKENYNEALEYYNEYVNRSDSPDPMAYKEMADVNIRLGNLDRALEIYDELLARESSPEYEKQRRQLHLAILNKAREAAQAENYEESIDLYKEFIANSDTLKEVAYSEMADINLKLGNYNDAVNVYDEALYDNNLPYYAEERQLVFQNILSNAKYAAEKDEFEEAKDLYEDMIEKSDTLKTPALREAARTEIISDNKSAAEIYEELLKKDYKYDIDKQRAKVLLMSGDTLGALNEFERLATVNPKDIETQLYLGDAYFYNKNFNMARVVYETIEGDAPDEYEVDKRISWLPERPYKEGSPGYYLQMFSDNAFAYLNANPVFYIFNDNLNFRYMYTGISLETGLLPFLSIGGTYIRGALKGDVTSFGASSATEYVLNYSTIKGNLFIRPADFWTITLGYGVMKETGILDHPLYEVIVRYEPEKKNYKVSASYQHSDGAVILYSSMLVPTRITAESYRIDGEYHVPRGLELKGYYQLIRTIDEPYWSYSNNNGIGTTNENYGNAFMGRLGRQFYEEWKFGYEYYYTGYQQTSSLYYSPGSFESHSIWAEWLAYLSDDLEIRFEGKLGYVPASDFIIREIKGKAQYQLYERIRLNFEGFFSSNVREGTGYSSSAFVASAYIAVF